MDINKEIQITSDKIIAEKLPAMVEQSVTKMLESVISDVFSSYSPMAKQIKAKIEEKLNVNLQQFDLIDYNALIAKTINDNIVKQVNLEPILSLTQKSLGLVNKKEMKLSELVNMLIEESMENSDEQEGEISLFIEKITEHDWVEIYLDMEAGKQKDDCSIRFLIAIKQGNMFSFHCKDWWTKLGSVSPSRLTMLSGVEHSIFRLYSAQVKIEIDTLDFDNSWSKY